MTFWSSLEPRRPFPGEAWGLSVAMHLLQRSGVILCFVRGWGSGVRAHARPRFTTCCRACHGCSSAGTRRALWGPLGLGVDFISELMSLLLLLFGWAAKPTVWSSQLCLASAGLAASLTLQCLLRLSREQSDVGFSSKAVLF